MFHLNCIGCNASVNREKITKKPTCFNCKIKKQQVISKKYAEEHREKLAQKRAEKRIEQVKLGVTIIVQQYYCKNCLRGFQSSHKLLDVICPYCQSLKIKILYKVWSIAKIVNDP